MFLPWLQRGGLRQTEGIHAPRLLGHLTIAVAGLAIWIAYLATDETARAG